MTSHLPADVARCAGYVSSDFGELRENCEDCRRRTAQPAQEDNSTDPLYEQAIAIVRQYRRGSISAVQRKLAIGYNRAAVMLEAMERDGIVTPWGPGGSGRDYVPEGQRVPRMTPPPVIVFECQSYVPDGSAEA